MRFLATLALPAGALVTVPTLGRATLFELLWLVAGLFAIGYALSNLADALRDRRDLPELRDLQNLHDLHYRMLRTVAAANVRNELFRFGIALLIVATGAVGVTTPNPLGGRTSLTGLFVTVALVGIALLTAIRGWLDSRTRRILYEDAGRRIVRRARRRV